MSPLPPNPKFLLLLSDAAWHYSPALLSFPQVTSPLLDMVPLIRYRYLPPVSNISSQNHLSEMESSSTKAKLGLLNSRLST